MARIVVRIIGPPELTMILTTLRGIANRAPPMVSIACFPERLPHLTRITDGRSFPADDQAEQTQQRQLAQEQSRRARIRGGDWRVRGGIRENRGRRGARFR